MIEEIIDLILKTILIICLVDIIIIFVRLVKPIRKMLDKLTEESQRIRFEMGKIAEEIAVIRKSLQKNSKE